MKSRSRLVSTAFAVALIIFAVIGWMAYRSMSAITTSDAWENHSYQVIHEFEALLNALLDAQNGERGFIITGSDDYLEPYRVALGKIAVHRSSLRALTKDNLQQQRRLDALDVLVERKLSELDVTVQARRTEDFRVVSRMVLEHLSKDRMEAIRNAVADGVAEEMTLLQTRTARKQADLSEASAVLQTGGIAGVVILLAVFYLLRREIAQRSAAEVVLTARNAELEEARDRELAQNWMKTGINELNAALRGEKRVEDVARIAVSFISRYLGAGAGSVYLAQDEAQTLHSVATYAYTRDSRDSIALGEGVAGEAALEKRAIFVAGVPAGYLTIGSTLGEAAPRTVAALPLLHDDRLVGVVELASFDEFTPLQQAFLAESAVVVGGAISVNQGRQKVNDLLQQSQFQEEELRVQQEELQQSNEELEERARLLEEQREQIEARNRELQDAAREIQAKAEEVERVSSYKSDFLANMSHELRTPLNSLMILSGQLARNKEGNLTERQVEFAETINSAGSDLLNLINDILDLSKIEAGRLEFLYEEVPPQKLCDDVQGIFRPVAEEKGLHFDVINEMGAEPLWLDPHRTLQVLKNLLSNAFKFTAEGGVSLRLHAAPPSASPVAGPAVAFSVTDTGIGIPPEKSELVFHAFHQGDSSTSRRFGGTGLGLAISRELAQGMNGALLFSPGAAGGSVFTLYLPVAQPAVEKEPSAPQSTGDAEERGGSAGGRCAAGAVGCVANLAGRAGLDGDLQRVEESDLQAEKRVLIVEDDPLQAGALEALLERRNVSLTVADSGGRAVELLGGNAFDCIVLDLGLADMSGFDLLEHIGTMEEQRRIPVIVHTGKVLSPEENLRLQRYAGTIIIKGAKSPERLLNEVTLFLHGGTVPEEKVVRAIADSEAILAGKKVLLVDDDMRNVFSLSSVLSERGMRVIEAENGKAALKKLEEHPDVNLVLMDVMMPEMDGYEATGAIRRDPRFAELPIIALTAKAMKGDREACLKAGASDYITKPVDVERLLSLLRVWLYHLA